MITNNIVSGLWHSMTYEHCYRFSYQDLTMIQRFCLFWVILFITPILVIFDILLLPIEILYCIFCYLYKKAKEKTKSEY